jgi:hypothetical protein
VDRQLAQLDSFIRFMQLAQERGEAAGTAFAGPLNVGGGDAVGGIVRLWHCDDYQSGHFVVRDILREHGGCPWLSCPETTCCGGRSA